MNNQMLTIYIFYCSNNLEQDKLADICNGVDGITVKSVGLPCSGKIDIPYLIKAFETGADGVVIVSCEQSECAHLEGTLRSQKRAEAVEALLEEIGMAKGRIAVIELKKDNVKQVTNEIREFFDRIRKLPRQQAQNTTASM